jgi:hypothetical protein
LRVPQFVSPSPNQPTVMPCQAMSMVVVHVASGTRNILVFLGRMAEDMGHALHLPGTIIVDYFRRPSKESPRNCYSPASLALPEKDINWEVYAVNRKVLCFWVLETQSWYTFTQKLRPCWPDQEVAFGTLARRYLVRALLVMKKESGSAETTSQTGAIVQRPRLKRKGRPPEPPTGDPDIDVRRSHSVLRSTPS